MSILLSSLDTPDVSMIIPVWQGHPQEPFWHNESVTRLGGEEASTQVTNKRSEVQTSVAIDYFDTYEAARTNFRQVLEFPNLGRFRWTGHENEEIESLIFSTIQYNCTKGKYVYFTTCYSYAVTYTLSYIVTTSEFSPS